MPYTEPARHRSKAQPAGQLEQEREPQNRQEQRMISGKQLTEWIEQEQQNRQGQSVQSPQTREEEDDAALLRRAKSRALYILEASDKTEKQLREKLDRNYPPHITEQVVAYAKSLHYIDDLRYAKRYVESRGGEKSRRAICMELQAKGISGEILEEVRDLFSEEAQEALALRLAGQQFRKRKLDAVDAPEEEVRKVCQFLLRRGFSYREARKAICSLRDAAGVGETAFF